MRKKKIDELFRMICDARFRFALTLTVQRVISVRDPLISMRRSKRRSSPPGPTYFPVAICGHIHTIIVRMTPGVAGSPEWTNECL